ncbi:MAG: Tad domain-containing protein [Kiritimatiellae bacterium]|nr:Tad domain-containing protein [Kiritimatiellia bacterium]
MLNAINKSALRLWRDESGVVLAVTVIVFLSLFMMACAVYAVGETVRQRIELQNAADAGAYSGAIVEADCLSRVAAVNRAMSWTYVQMCRMEMDYIVDKWLMLTLQRWDIDNLKMQMFNMPSTCNRGLPWYCTGKGASVGNAFSHKRILLNKHHLTTTDEIKSVRQQAAGQGKSYTALAPKIDKCREQIKQMNEKEKQLINKLPGRIKTCVKEVLKKNLKDTWNDGFAGGGNIMYALKQEEQPLDNNFRVLEHSEEDDFLRHSDYIPEQGNNAKQVLERGTDDWFIQQYESGGPGIQRQYKRGHPILISEWEWASSIWEIVEGVCVIVAQTSGSSEVKGDDSQIYSSRYYITEKAEPQVLKERYFAKGGAIVVGATRRLNNPFQFMAVGSDVGIMKPFNVSGGNRYMWSASAAIAGYNPKPLDDARGKYEVTYENNSGDKLWNLKTSDWDAVLLPLHRAWAQGKDRKWNGATAGQILNAVKGAWEPLYGGGGAPGDQGAPKLMGGGGEPSYNGAEGWVVH